MSIERLSRLVSDCIPHTLSCGMGSSHVKAYQMRGSGLWGGRVALAPTDILFPCPIVFASNLHGISYRGVPPSDGDGDF